MADDRSWGRIFDDYRILQNNFNESPFVLSAEQIKISCQDFKKTAQKEVRILCKQDTRESRPRIFKENQLFPIASTKKVSESLYVASSKKVSETNTEQ